MVGAPNKYYAESLSKQTQEIVDSYYAPGNTLGQSNYDFSYMEFPADLSMDDVGHYMVININVPTTSILGSSGLATNKPAGNFTNLFTPLNQVSKVDVLRFGQNVVGGQQSPLGSIPRFTRRIAQSIAIHMPQGELGYYFQNDYQNVSLTGLGGELITGALNLAKNLGGLGKAGAQIGGAVQTGIGTAASLNRTPINPVVEVIYTSSELRRFRFDWLLAPRNEIESETIKQLIHTLEFHASPELNSLTAGLTWIPPAEFDITFFNRGQENLNLPRINTCALVGIKVEYEPNGVYATFRNGHPVAVQLSLDFVELEVRHKQRVVQGF